MNTSKIGKDWLYENELNSIFRYTGNQSNHLLSIDKSEDRYGITYIRAECNDPVKRRKINEVFENIQKQYNIKYVVPYSSFNSVTLRLFEMEKPERDSAGAFIDSLDVVFDLKTIYEDVFRQFRIPKLPYSFSKLKGLIDKGKCNEAIQEAKRSAHLESFANVQFELGEYCENINRQDSAYEFYDAISHENSCYPKAQERKLFLLRDQRAQAQNGSIQLTEDERRDLLVNELDLLMSKPEEQGYIDKLIAEQCGQQLGEEPIIKNVRYDAQTILALSALVKALSIENAQLKKL